jgi:hypothetical protein
MNEKFYNQLHAEGVLSDESLARVKADRGFMLFSLHWEIRTLLYTGVVLLAAGLGALIYQNIDCSDLYLLFLLLF